MEGRIILLLISLKSTNGAFALFSMIINKVNEIAPALKKPTIICGGGVL
ncbi:MAG TPA: hypothetical protein VKA95_17570 [Nitrososphaeraceae archaeon]|nr:hypothetical protein [Nitrososphaeraceae archaeon]